MVGDVLGPLVQGPAHAPDHDPGVEVAHDPGDIGFYHFYFNNTPVTWKTILVTFY